MEQNNASQELSCVLFPGVVKNADKAIQCLGGIKNISTVQSNPTKKRLGLTFQPENPFVKKVYSDCKRTAGVLLKVKVRKKKVGDQVQKEVVSSTILGKVKKIHKYEAMSDFQYMPVHREGNGPLRCIIEDIIPSGMDDVSFINDPPSSVPLFIVPTSYSRSDRPVAYNYTDKRYSGKKGSDDEDTEHVRLRTDRGQPKATFVFNLIDDMPAEPNQFYVRAAKLETSKDMRTMYEKLKTMFEERPIWSQNLVRYHTKYRLAELKVLMPCVAVRMDSGPWRMHWVRYGYDPRKEPEARKYQTLDFRLRHQAGIHSMVLTRDQVANYKKADRVKHNRRKSLDEAFNTEEVTESVVYFRPGMVPGQRQVFYMYCDVHLPEVEALLSAEPAPGSLCHPARGWLPPHAGHAARDAIFRHVKQTLLASHSSDLKYERGSSDEGSDWEDADDSNSDEPSTSKT